jgi:biotin operon repressor
MQVLRVLRQAESVEAWLTPQEIGDKLKFPRKSATSAIRRLRTKGFRINRVKRSGRIDEYKLFSKDAQ